MLASIRAILAGLLALLLGLAPLATAAAKPEALDVRIGSHAGKTRFVVELTEQPDYRIFSLADPYRVVIDLPAMSWRVPAGHEPRNQGSISALRFGLFSPVTSRVVLDLSEPVKIDRAFVLAPENGTAHRLVVDLEPISRDAFLAPAQRTPITSARPLPKLQVAVPVVPPVEREDRRPTIVIDPGHGGVDPGAIGISGTKEKDLVLTYAREVKRQLEATGRFNVVLTRDSDLFLRLQDRKSVARRSEADLFVSLHADAHGTPDVRGASVYFLSERASDAEAAALAAKENKADIIAGIDLSDQTDVVSMILIDLAQRDTMNLSTRFAQYLVEALHGAVPLLKNPRRSAGFLVLKSPDVPSVLFEIGYMSNPQEESLLLSEAHRAEVARSVVAAAQKFFAWHETVRRF